MKIRIVLAVIIVIVLVSAAHADWMTLSVGRIDVQEFINATIDTPMMEWLSLAGGARGDANERISRIVEEHCAANPAECAALGVSVRPGQ